MGFDDSRPSPLDDWRTTCAETLRQLPDVCTFEIGPLSGALCSTLLSSLSAARSSIISLSFRHRSDLEESEASQLLRLDLSKLQNLTFSSENARIIRFDGIEGSDVTVARRSGALLNEILRSCTETLRTLSLGDGYFTWPDPLHRSLSVPNLKEIKIVNYVDLRFKPFAAFVRTCTALERLTLRSVFWDMGAVRHLWDVIRDHPRRMLVTLEGDTFSMVHFTGDQSQRERFDGKPNTDVSYNLAMYLSGKGDWDASLSSRFDDIEADDDDGGDDDG